ncbi:MAG: hypothetical protein HKN46_08690 [Acidimicrobiia bacterium]|nr:hypothetical protein [Acidimicrobiia bacterium]
MRPSMDIVTVPWLKALSSRGPGPCVSLYLSTHRQGGQAREQDPLRLKNLLASATTELEQLGHRAPEIKRLLQPAHDLIRDAGFWAAPEDGLAVFLADGRMDVLRLPVPFEELSIVADRFHVRPLLPSLAVGHSFYLLAISKGATHLYRGTRFRMSEAEVAEMPAGIDEALWYLDREGQLQHRSGGGRTVFHGHGGIKDTAVDELLQYLRAIDHAVSGLLAGQRVPLVVAGLEGVVSRYHQVSRYPYLLDDAIVGNPDDMTADDLHAAAWRITEPRYASLRKRQESAMDAALGGRLTSLHLEEIAGAAFQGRVDALWISAGERRWGRWNPVEAHLDLHDTRRPGDYDVVDRIAITAWERGAALYVDDAWKTPGAGPLAALYRY